MTYLCHWLSEKNDFVLGTVQQVLILCGLALSRLGLLRLQPDFRIQISFKKANKDALSRDAFWVWILTFQDSDFNLVSPMHCYGSPVLWNEEDAIHIIMKYLGWFICTQHISSIIVISILSAQRVKVTCSNRIMLFVAVKPRSVPSTNGMSFVCRQNASKWAASRQWAVPVRKRRKDKSRWLWATSPVELLWV